jgi:integrase
MQTWSAEELRGFLGYVQKDRLYPLWLTEARTGLRRGELLGLQWSDVDLETGRASIRRALVSVDYKLTLSEPKTVKGKRSVPLPPETVAALREWRKAQLEERLANKEGNFVFTREDGSPVHPDRLSKMFEALSRKAGLPVIRFHDLRHTWATLALQAGVAPKVVSEILGHANIGITLDTYSHVIPAMEEDASARVAGLIFGQA